MGNDAAGSMGCPVCLRPHFQLHVEPALNVLPTLSVPGRRPESSTVSPAGTLWLWAGAQLAPLLASSGDGSADENGLGTGLVLLQTVTPCLGLHPLLPL